MILTTTFTLIAIAGVFALQHWFENFDRAGNPKQRNKYSILWHSAQWFTLTSIALMFISFYELWNYIPILVAAMTLWWWGFDGYKGLKYGRGFLYAGDGKGSTIEIAINWLAQRWTGHFPSMYFAVKIAVTMIVAAWNIWIY